MDDAILISNINDFIFCPVSIYFHNLYGNRAAITYQSEAQIRGTKAHETIDNRTYSTRKSILMSLNVYCEQYNLVGKIDLYDLKTGILTERKNKIAYIYDGYVFQLYAQCFAMREMGYTVSKIQIYSISDNKKYPIELPENNPKMFYDFEQTIEQMRIFKMEDYVQENIQKCKNCIYEPSCDRSLI